MYTIALNNLGFYSYHGLLKEENLIGNNFTVDIFVGLPDELVSNEDLSSTVNYAVLFSIIQTAMAVPRQLLETVVQEIHDEVYRLNNHITFIEIRLSKLKPPIDGMTGNAVVTLRKEY